jgi:hypothetical protein
MGNEDLIYYCRAPPLLTAQNVARAATDFRTPVLLPAMTVSTRLLLLGAGRSASSLIQYLLAHAPAEKWFLTVADAYPAHLAPALATHSEFVRVVPFDVQDAARLDELVSQADMVMSQ